MVLHRPFGTPIAVVTNSYENDNDNDDSNNDNDVIKNMMKF